MSTETDFVTKLGDAIVSAEIQAVMGKLADAIDRVTEAVRPVTFDPTREGLAATFDRLAHITPEAIARLTGRPEIKAVRVETDREAERADKFWRTLGKKVRNGSRIRDGYDSHRR